MNCKGAAEVTSATEQKKGSVQAYKVSVPCYHDHDTQALDKIEKFTTVICLAWVRQYGFKITSKEVSAASASKEKN